MPGSLRELSRRRCGSLRGGRLAPAGRAAIALALLSVAPALSAREKEVRARWEELAPLVERRDVETVLKNGVHVRGRAEKVLPEALEVRVKKTSDAAVIPKGRTRIPRELVTVLTVRWKQGPARFLLAPVVAAGVLVWLTYRGVSPLVADSFHWEMIPISGGMVYGLGKVGHMIGSRIDQKRLRIVVVSGAPLRAHEPPYDAQGHGRIQIEGGIPCLH